MTASASRTVATASASAPEGKPVSRLSVMRVGQVAQLDGLDAHVLPGQPQGAVGGRRELVGEQPRRRGLAEPAR